MAAFPHLPAQTTLRAMCTPWLWNAVAPLVVAFCSITVLRLRDISDVPLDPCMHLEAFIYPDRALGFRNSPPFAMQAQPAGVMQDHKSLSSATKRPELTGCSPDRKSPVRFISDPYDYPRKRTSLACEVCRVRKVRCDAGKPGCGSCTKLGVACSYATVRNCR